MDYTMAQVTHLTGIQSHTLRVWERRYDFVKAKRKESKFRYYTEDQLRILLNTSILLQNGFRISAVAKLEESEINQEVELIFNQSAEIKSDQIQALVLAMLHFDEPCIVAKSQRKANSRCHSQVGQNERPRAKQS